MIKRGAALALLVLAGCALLTKPGSPRPNEQVFSLPPLHVITQVEPNGGPAAEPFDDGYEDRTGVIHIHTRCSQAVGCGAQPRHSHDAHGTFEDVIRVGHQQGLDFVILTEHNNLNALRDGLQGWHGRVLALIGMELSLKSGHLLALNVTQEIDRHALTPQQVIDEIARQGGLSFIAHPFFKKARWTDWTVTGFTGIEAYNFAHDTMDENKARLALWTLTAPTEPFYYSILDRPYDPLATWDAMIRQHGRVTGIGAPDAHEFHALGMKFAPYEAVFQLARTHVLTPPGELTGAAVYDALRQGHAYVAIELTALGKGFQFAALQEGRIAGIMGDEVPLAPGLILKAHLPTPAQLTLYRDGTPVAEAIAQTWEYPVETPGAYRLEAFRHNKPWMFSNPIYVRPALDAPTG